MKPLQQFRVVIGFQNDVLCRIYMEDLTNHKKLAWPAILKFIFIHFVLLGIAFFVYASIMHLPVLPGCEQFSAFDARHYDIIRTKGYSFSPDHGSNVAFFPGFPYLWRYTGLGFCGISFLNLGIFIFSFAFLCRHFAKSKTEIFIFLSLPPVFFFFVPYSEAQFFFTSSVLLIGLLKRNHIMIMGGLFICSLCRSASNIFIPAIIMTELFAVNNDNRLRNIILYVSSALAGMFLVAWIQFMQTGQWWGFITTQSHWEVGLRKPEWPFRTWFSLEYLDGSALLFGVVISVILIYMGWKFLKGQRPKESKPVLFSLLFVAGLSMFPIFFKAGSLFSLNRYIVPTAFFFISGIYLARLRQFSLKDVSIAFIFIFAFWMISFRGFRPISDIPGYIMISLYLCLYLLLNNKSAKIATAATWLLYAINIFLQAHLFYRHINWHWVG